MRVRSMSTRFPRLLAVGLLLPLTSVTAQQRAPMSSNGTTAAPKPAEPNPLADEGYVTPSPSLARLVAAPREQNVNLTTPNPGSRRYFLRTVGDGLPSLQSVGKAHHNLGGLQVDYRGNRDRALTMRSSAGFELIDWASGRKTPVTIPAGARVSTPVWSPTGAQFAFLALFDNATQIYVADVATGATRAVTTRSTLSTNVTAPAWTADGSRLVTVLIPEARGAEPAEPKLATGPMVRLNENNKLKTRTYPDLLASPFEKALLAYHTTGQLAMIHVKTRAVTHIGTPGLIRRVDPSPDGGYFRVTYLEPPFSYLLPVASFGTREVLIDGAGRVLRELATRALREGEEPTAPSDPQPRPAAAAGAASAGRPAPVDTGKRNMIWHPFAGGLLYAQLAPTAAETGGARPDSTTAAPAASGAARRTDRLLHWTAPFDSTGGRTLYTTANRITGVQFSDNGNILFVSETGTSGTFEQAVFLDQNNATFTVIAPRGRGRGADTTSRAAAGARSARPSELITRPGRHGVPVVVVSTDGKSVFTQGTTPDSAGAIPRAFVEKIDIRTGARSRVYESSANVLETLQAPLDDDLAQMVVQRESPTMVPQSYVLTLASREAKQITQNVDLMPEITKAQRKTIVARRADGYAFNVKVTLPADYQNGTRLPAMFWFYPREYDNQDAYNRSLTQGGSAANRFPTYGPRSLAFIVTQGYALIEPDAPIFASEGQLPNDNYVVDLRNNLAAVIDALDTLAIIDRQRLGIGGHSYGAFSTVNAMVHTPFFKAGIAGDGAYNRTLTPNGFQSERRDLWQGRQTYLEMSPFLYADQLNGALLLYHSTEDQNVGTDPINSIKLFHALQGLGKTASLYMYPYEDHGPIARETVLDQWARWVAWLDKYVKNAGAKPKVTTM